jgi:glycosyltransferase involved in cell wall biosynthesis
LIIKTSDAAVDVMLRGQLRYLRGTSLAPVAVAAEDSGRLAIVAAREGVRTHALPLRREPAPLDDVRALIGLIVLMLRLRPALVIYGTPKATLLAGVAAVLTGVPARVQVLHCLRLETTSGFLRHFLLMTERLAVRLATQTVAVGEGIRARCVELGIDTARMTVLGRGSVVGVDTVRARALDAESSVRRRQRADMGARDDEFVIGFVGRVTRDKGVETLVRAVEQARRSDPSIRLVLVGPDEGIADFDADVRALLGAPWVTLTGNVPDPAEHYTAFDAFCLPSHREGLPTAVLEAWAARVPVVASDCTGLDELVVDEVTGLVVPVGDVNGYRAAFVRLVTDQAARESLAAAGASFVEEHYSQASLWPACAAFYEAARDAGRKRDSSGR